MKPGLLSLLILTACQSGGGNTTTTQQILHCENYGAITESTEVTYESQEGTGIETLPEPELQSGDTTEPTSQDPVGTGLQPVAPGLGIGTIKSAISEAEALECESSGLCAIVGATREKILVEHCSNISFPEVTK